MSDVITTFVLDDFPDLTAEERKILEENESLRNRLAGHFLCGMPDWPEAATYAVEWLRVDLAR